MKKKIKAKASHPQRHNSKSYPSKYRIEILDYAESNSIRAASKKYEVPEGTIQTWRYRLRKQLARDQQSQSSIKSESEATNTNSSSQTSLDSISQKQPIKECPTRGRRYPPKLRREILEHAEANTIASAAAKYQVAGGTIYTWRGRSRREESSKNSSQHKTALPGDQQLGPAGIKTEVMDQEERDKAVLNIWRQNQGFGPSQIKNMLKRSGLRLSVGTVRNIMEEHGYVRPKMKPKESKVRYEASRPRELYHLDFYHFHIHKQKQVLLFIQDDYSRFIAGWALVQSETADTVTRSFEEAVAQHGKPERAMSDRGSAFHSWRGLSRFERMLEDYEINFHLAKKPQVNGKVEALNAAFQKECLRQQEFLDLSDASRAIGNWVDRFNHQRTHHGLGGLLVPADRFYGMVERTTKLIELGQGADALDILNPDSRGLELFRVVSYGGNPQVYLMGKKIMG